MNKLVILLLLAALMGTPLFACCGGNSVRQYEDAIGNHPLYSKAEDAARHYLTKKGVASGLRPFVDDQQIGLQYGSSGVSNEEWAWQNAMNDKTTVNALSIIFMIDHDLNVFDGNISGSPIRELYYPGQLYNQKQHKLDYPNSDCHLQHTPEESADKALTCPHHEKHWTGFIEPRIKDLITTDEEGS